MYHTSMGLAGEPPFGAACSRRPPECSPTPARPVHSKGGICLNVICALTPAHARSAILPGPPWRRHVAENLTDTCSEGSGFPGATGYRSSDRQMSFRIVLVGDAGPGDSLQLPAASPAARSFSETQARAGHGWGAGERLTHRGHHADAGEAPAASTRFLSSTLPVRTGEGSTVNHEDVLPVGKWAATGLANRSEYGAPVPLFPSSEGQLQENACQLRTSHHGSQD